MRATFVGEEEGEGRMGVHRMWVMVALNVKPRRLGIQLKLNCGLHCFQILYWLKKLAEEWSLDVSKIIPLS